MRTFKHYTFEHNEHHSLIDLLVDIESLEDADEPGDFIVSPDQYSVTCKGDVQLIGGDSLPDYLISGE